MEAGFCSEGRTYPSILLGGYTGQPVLFFNAADEPLKHLILCHERFIKTPCTEMKPTSLKSSSDNVSKDTVN